MADNTILVKKPEDQAQNKRSYQVQIDGPDGALFLRAEMTAGRVYSLGSQPGNDIVLEDPAIDNPQLFFEIDNTGMFIKNKGQKSSIILNGKSLPPGFKSQVEEEADLLVSKYKIKVKRKGIPGAVATSGSGGQPVDMEALKREFIRTKVYPEFVNRLDVNDMEKRGLGKGEMRSETLRTVKQVLSSLPDPFHGAVDMDKMAVDCVAEFIGLGPLEEMLTNKECTEIMVNGPNMVFIELKGKVQQSPVKFISNESLQRIIQRIVSSKNRQINDATPFCDTRLDDGSRVNAVIPPLAMDGACLTIRKFPEKRLGTDDLIKFGAIDEKMAKFIELTVHHKQNVIVSGGTGTGKTTVLNICSRFIPEHERVITIEDSAELRLQQPHVVRLETRPPNMEGKGAVTIRQLVINSLRMRPDRVVVGECRGGECFDMLQAMNTGHEGSMTTIHANTARDGLGRIESMCLMAGMDMPLNVIRGQIASAVNYIFQLSRFPDGSRKMIDIAEITGMQDGVILLQSIFKFHHEGFKDKRVVGRFAPTGIVPKYIKELRQVDPTLSLDIFQDTGKK